MNPSSDANIENLKAELAQEYRKSMEKLAKLEKQHFVLPLTKTECEINFLRGYLRGLKHHINSLGGTGEQSELPIDDEIHPERRT